jgi:hypothetical protein
VVAHFKLARRARIRISVQQLAPVCRTLDSYALLAKKGRNLFRFPAKRITGIGTYRFVARLHRRQLFAVRARRLATGRVRRGGTADACTTLPSTANTAFSIVPAAQLHVKSERRTSHTGFPRATGGEPASKNPIVRAVSLSDAPASVRALLLALLALSIALLGAAAVPQSALPAGRAAALLTQRRAYLAAAGIWLLAVVVIVTIFT